MNWPLIILCAILIYAYTLTRRKSRREWYRKDYMKSAHWKKISARKKASMAYTCEECGKRKRDGATLDTHHLTYKRIGRERMSDLRVLCRTCHDKVHKKK